MVAAAAHLFYFNLIVFILLSDLNDALLAPGGRHLISYTGTSHDKYKPFGTSALIASAAFHAWSYPGRRPPDAAFLTPSGSVRQVRSRSGAAPVAALHHQPGHHQLPQLRPAGDARLRAQAQRGEDVRSCDQWTGDSLASL